MSTIRRKDIQVRAGRALALMPAPIAMSAGAAASAAGRADLAVLSSVGRCGSAESR
jgi:hypothetical protein